ncbi:MAG: hypothetical protein HQL21_00490 [Candidatus Omnitrophica bacterium]|nr:hypothetical protein [Candidatus Omnitrophota bacterium]
MIKRTIITFLFLCINGIVFASPMPPSPECEVTIKMGTCWQEMKTHPLYGDRNVTTCSAEVLELKRTIKNGYEGQECSYTPGQIIIGLSNIASPGTVLSGVLQLLGDEGGVGYDFRIQDKDARK